jgi:four helix bundle protein
MNIRSSKLKAQSSREAPNTNQERVGHLNEWDVECAAESGNGALILRDGDEGKLAACPWNLEERTARFGERVIRLAKRLPRNPVNDRLSGQTVGAGTSVGANYCEANESVSRKDFTNTTSRCMKEAKESKFFLRMVAAAEPSLTDEAREMYREAHELLRIFGSMRHKRTSSVAS